MAGARLGGDVTLEALVAAFYSGLQLVAILACVGAANALANPTRLLKSVPGALYEVGVAVVVALTLVPSALAHLQQIREARRLRGQPSRGISVDGPHRHGRPRRRTRALLWHWRRRWTRAGSDGFGHCPAGERRVTAALTLSGLFAAARRRLRPARRQHAATGRRSPARVGIAMSLTGLHRANRRAVRTVYRPDPWRWPESATVASGLVAIALRTRQRPSLAPTSDAAGHHPAHLACAAAAAPAGHVARSHPGVGRPTGPDLGDADDPGRCDAADAVRAGPTVAAVAA